VSENGHSSVEYDRLIPDPSTSDEFPRVNCLRCGEPATNHYEGGSEFVDLCDDCLSEFGDWLRSVDMGNDRGEKR